MSVAICSPQTLDKLDKNNLIITFMHTHPDKWNAEIWERTKEDSRSVLLVRKTEFEAATNQSLIEKVEAWTAHLPV